MTQEQPMRQEEAWEQIPEEHFSDVFWSYVNPWSCAITFGLRATSPKEKSKPTLRIRMPLQQAKALAVILLRTIRKYETDADVNIELPRDVLNKLNIAPEDWERFK